MGRLRLQKTLADYVAIAISPVLIMLLVGSFSFFLLELFPLNDATGGEWWILFWFVFAIVLVARIGIEQGKHHAAGYAAVLALATAFAVADLQVLFFLVIVWWCANRLTWDCTLIDDSDDSSGEGLLGIAGLDSRHATGDAGLSATSKSGIWKRILLGPATQQGGQHAAGLWLIYFSVLALPVFGFGYNFIPLVREDSRRFSEQLLVTFVAAALGLLLTTSFLNLRRYLRQRRVKMPVNVTKTWIATGSVLAICVVVGAWVVPRPEAEFSVTALLDRVSGSESSSIEASVLEGAGAQSGQRDGVARVADKTSGTGNENPRDAQQGGSGDQPGGGDAQQGGSGKQPGGGDAQQGGSGDQPGGDDAQQGGSGKQPGGDDAQQGGSGKQPGGDNAQQGGSGKQSGGGSGAMGGSPDVPNPTAPDVTTGDWGVIGLVTQLLKWVIYGLMAAGVVWVLLRHRYEFYVLCCRWVQSMIAFWRRLFSVRSPAASDEGQGGPAAMVHRRFAEFHDPFQSRLGASMTEKQLISYTFEALEAWARDYAQPRAPEQTPTEFARCVMAQTAVLSDCLPQFTRLYNRVTYAEAAVPPEELEDARQLWSCMRQALSGVRSPQMVS